MSKQTTVLVVEDEIVSRTLMTRSLEKLGYDVTVAVSAEEGLDILKSTPIDIVMLDWMLPGMNGVELCRLLRADEQFSYLYIIFLTSMTEHEDLVLALEAGANDYSTKPFKLDEISARLNVAVRLIKLEQDLKKQSELSQKYADEMEKLAEERAAQLVHSDRMASIGTLSAGVAHEINNPMTFIAGNVKVLEDFIPFINNMHALAPADHPDIDQFDFIKEEVPRLVEAMNNGVKRTSKIINSLKAFSHQKREDDDTLEYVSIPEVIEDSILLCSTSLSKNVTINTNCDVMLPGVLGDHQQLEQIFVNLMINASDAMEEAVGSTIDISGAVLDESIVISIADNGPGIPQDLLDKIWDPFFTTKPVGKGTGLGLSISFGIIEAHGGRITVENTKTGAKFTITLPMYKEDN